MKGQRAQHSRTGETADSAEWRTPPDVVARLAQRFGPFHLDVCAADGNSVAPIYITKAEDCLRGEWTEYAVPGRNVWMNPPYGGPERACNPKGCEKLRCVKRGYHVPEDVPGVGDFMLKARQQAMRHGFRVTTLVPCRPDTEWWRVAVTWALVDPYVVAAGDSPGRWLGGMVLEDGERLMRWERLEATILEWAGRIPFIRPGQQAEDAEGAPFPSAVVCYRGLRLGQ